MIKALIFDWGDTLMKDFPQYSGPMASWPEVELMPNVQNALEQLSAHYTIAVASNAGDSDCLLMREAFKRADVDKYIHHVFTSRELGYEKPDLQFFNQTVTQLGVNPTQAVMIGNDYAKDISPAKKAGLHTVFYTSTMFLDSLVDADFLIRNMKKLPAVIELLNCTTP